MREVILSSALLHQANLSGAILERAVSYDAEFIGTILKQAKLRGAGLETSSPHSAGAIARASIFQRLGHRTRKNKRQY